MRKVISQTRSATAAGDPCAARRDSTPSTADEVVDTVRSGFGQGLRVELDGDRLVIVDVVP